SRGASPKSIAEPATENASVRRPSDVMRRSSRTAAHILQRGKIAIRPMKLCDFLFDELRRHGVRQIFGIPGDFVLSLYEAFEDDRRFELVRLSHEPAVGFAADGAARIRRGIGVCCVTYGAGGLNMINAVACAYAEESPLIVLSGGPGGSGKNPGMPGHPRGEAHGAAL